MTHNGTIFKGTIGYIPKEYHETHHYLINRVLPMYNIGVEAYQLIHEIEADLVSDATGDDLKKVLTIGKRVSDFINSHAYDITNFVTHNGEDGINLMVRSGRIDQWWLNSLIDKAARACMHVWRRYDNRRSSLEENIVIGNPVRGQHYIPTCD